MLAQLNSQMRVAQNMMMRLSEFSMIPRMILSSSGSVNRVAALLDAVDPAQYDALNDAPGNQISGSLFLGRFVGLFIRAAFVTSFAPLQMALTARVAATASDSRAWTSRRHQGRG